jgi:hypothetical protein
VRASLDAELERRAAVGVQPGRWTCQDVGVLVGQRREVRGIPSVLRQGECRARRREVDVANQELSAVRKGVAHLG